MKAKAIVERFTVTGRIREVEGGSERPEAFKYQ